MANAPAPPLHLYVHGHPPFGERVSVSDWNQSAWGELHRISAPVHVEKATSDSASTFVGCISFFVPLGPHGPDAFKYAHQVVKDLAGLDNAPPSCFVSAIPSVSFAGSGASLVADRVIGQRLQDDPRTFLALATRVYLVPAESQPVADLKNIALCETSTGDWTPCACQAGGFPQDDDDDSLEFADWTLQSAEALLLAVVEKATDPETKFCAALYLYFLAINQEALALRPELIVTIDDGELALLFEQGYELDFPGGDDDLKKCSLWLKNDLPPLMRANRALLSKRESR